MAYWAIFGELVQPGITIQPQFLMKGEVRFAGAEAPISYELLIADADVIVTFDAPEDLNPYTLRNVAEDLAQRACDVLAFADGLGLRIQMRSAAIPGGEPHILPEDVGRRYQSRNHRWHQASGIETDLRRRRSTRAVRRSKRPR